MSETEKAILAGGCFWCTEAVFKPVKGVKGRGLGGTSAARPKTRPITRFVPGITGHAEAVEITFDPEVVSYDTLLDVFFRHS